MRRSSADPEPVGRSNKDLLRRRITLPSSLKVLSSLSNGQAVSDINVVNGNAVRRLESRKSDADAKSLSAGSSASAGAANPQTLTFTGTDFDLQKTRTAIASLHRKIHHTMELIRTEQQTQAENVNEYLESVKSDRPNSQHTKSVFEKKNQKSTQAIMAHQGKLEAYQKRLAEVQMRGTSAPKDVFKNVSQGLNGFASPVVMTTESMVTKGPSEFASMLKHKFGSTDNVSTGGSADERRGSLDEPEQTLSLDKASVLGVRHSFGAVTDAVDNTLRQDNTGKHQPRSSSPHSPTKGRPPLPAIPRTLQEIQTENNGLRIAVNALKSQMLVELSDLKQTLEVERDLCDRLEEQLNDLTELHQHEMANIKQEMVSLEEKMQYTLDDRTRDLHELLENCLQRVMKVETQQHHQLIQTEGGEGSSFSIAKIINFVLAFLSFCLILLSTLASLVSPFLSTRLRYFMTFLFVVCSVLAWKNWDFVSSAASAFSDAYLLPWLPQFFQHDSNETAAGGGQSRKRV